MHLIHRTLIIALALFLALPGSFVHGVSMCCHSGALGAQDELQYSCCNPAPEPEKFIISTSCCGESIIGADIDRELNGTNHSSCPCLSDVPVSTTPITRAFARNAPNLFSTFSLRSIWQHPPFKSEIPVCALGLSIEAPRSSFAWETPHKSSASTAISHCRLLI